MSASSHRVHRIAAFRRFVIIFLIIGIAGYPTLPSQADVAGSRARLALDSTIDFLSKTTTRPLKVIDTRVKPRQIQSASEREAQVTRLRLCPRRLLMYVGEEFALSPLPLDSKGAPVHGVVFSWASGDPQIATVASDGTVAGEERPLCCDGIGGAKTGKGQRRSTRRCKTEANKRAMGRRACKRLHSPEQDPAPSSASGPSAPQFAVQLLPPPDPDPPPNVAAAGARFNAHGHPRFSPDVAIQAATSADNQLGSSNFHLSIPIFGSGGRGVGVDLSLAYNGRIWTKDPGTNTIWLTMIRDGPHPVFA